MQYRDQYFLEKLCGLRRDDGFSMNPVLVDVFYIMGLWPAIYTALLIPSGRRCWLPASFCIYSFTDLTYMAKRSRSNSKVFAQCQGRTASVAIYSSVHVCWSVRFATIFCPMEATSPHCSTKGARNCAIQSAGIQVICWGECWSLRYSAGV